MYSPYGKTKAARRKIPLNPAAATVLLKRQEKSKSDYLFPGRVPAGKK